MTSYMMISYNFKDHSIELQRQIIGLAEKAGFTHCGSGTGGGLRDLDFTSSKTSFDQDGLNGFQRELMKAICLEVFVSQDQWIKGADGEIKPVESGDIAGQVLFDEVA
jgi:hypothetical protein